MEIGGLPCASSACGNQHSEVNRHAALVVCRLFLDVLLGTIATARPRWGPQLCHGKPQLDPPDTLRQASKNPGGCQAAHETNEMDTPRDPCICLVIKTQHDFAMLNTFVQKIPVSMPLERVHTHIDYLSVQFKDYLAPTKATPDVVAST